MCYSQLLSNGQNQMTIPLHLYNLAPISKNMCNDSEIWKFAYTCQGNIDIVEFFDPIYPLSFPASLPLVTFLSPNNFPYTSISLSSPLPYSLCLSFTHTCVYIHTWADRQINIFLLCSTNNIKHVIYLFCYRLVW